MSNPSVTILQFLDSFTITNETLIVSMDGFQNFLSFPLSNATSQNFVLTGIPLGTTFNALISYNGIYPSSNTSNVITIFSTKNIILQINYDPFTNTLQLNQIGNTVVSPKITVIGTKCKEEKKK